MEQKVKSSVTKVTGSIGILEDRLKSLRGDMSNLTSLIHERKDFMTEFITRCNADLPSINHDIVTLSQLVNSVAKEITELDAKATEAQLTHMANKHAAAKQTLQDEVIQLESEQQAELKQLGVKVRSLLLEDGIEEAKSGAKLGLKPSKKYENKKSTLADITPKLAEEDDDWLDS